MIVGQGLLEDELPWPVPASVGSDAEKTKDEAPDQVGFAARSRQWLMGRLEAMGLGWSLMALARKRHVGSNAGRCVPMTARLDNRQFFEETAFDYWASRTKLTAIEEVVVDRSLSKGGRTLEAGTGAGRILFELQKKGFDDLHGFDYVPGFIELARRRDRAGSIGFAVQNAVDLEYPDAKFDQVIYLQQILCFIEDPADRSRAMSEAARVLKPGGTALLSFLCYEARMNRPLYAAFARYLSMQRRLRRRDVSLQYQPWLKTIDKPNLGALADRQPHVYWYRFREALEALDGAGFDVRWTASAAQLERDPGSEFDPRLGDPASLGGMLYVACRRR